MGTPQNKINWGNEWGTEGVTSTYTSGVFLTELCHDAIFLRKSDVDENEEINILLTKLFIPPIKAIYTWIILV